MGRSKSYHQPAPRQPTREEELESQIYVLQEQLTKTEGERDRLQEQLNIANEQDDETDGVIIDGVDKPQSIGAKLLAMVKKGCKVSRQKVYEAINTERDHMERIGYHFQTPGDWLLRMEHYLLKARDDLCCSKKPEGDELDQVRKVVALGVAWMEQHGAPRRVKSKTHPIPGQPDKHEPR